MSDRDEWCYLIDRRSREKENNAATPTWTPGDEKRGEDEMKLKKKRREKDDEEKRECKRASLTSGSESQGGVSPVLPWEPGLPHHQLDVDSDSRQHRQLLSVSKCVHTKSVLAMFWYGRFGRGYYWKSITSPPPYLTETCRLRQTLLFALQRHVPGLQRTAGQNIPKRVRWEQMKIITHSMQPF